MQFTTIYIKIKDLYISLVEVVLDGVVRWYQSPLLTNINMCYDNIIGIRGYCEATNTKYYLDDYGISLKSLVKSADERFITGKRLFESIIKRAWRDVFLDISFDGFKANEVLSHSTIGININTSMPSMAGLNGIILTLDKHCSLGRLYVSIISLSVEVGGNTDIYIVNNGVSQLIHTGAVANNSVLELQGNDFVSDSFSVLVDTSNIQVSKGSIAEQDCGCTYNYISVASTDGSNNFGLTVDVQVRCNIDKHLCKFADVLAMAVIYKALGLLWFEVMLSKRLNDYINNATKEESMQLVGFYDSSINIFQYLPDKTYVGGRPNVALGQYQIEMAKINIPKPKCSCCIECKDNNYSISIP